MCELGVNNNLHEIISNNTVSLRDIRKTLQGEEKHQNIFRKQERLIAS